MKSLTLLWKTLALEMGACCHVSTSHDYKTIVARTKNEGLSYLTIGLPAFGKELHKALEQGRVSSNLFSGYRRRGELPIFMGGFLDLIFDRGSGDLLDEPSTDSIFAVRQLTLLYEKILLPCSDERVAGAVDSFVRVDAEVKHADDGTSPESRERFRSMSARLWTDVFTDVDRLVFDGDVRPKHGPGATADRLRGNAKFDLREWPRRLDELFPFVEYALPSNGRYYTVADHVDFRDPGMERPVKVTPVPKNAKTPRIIAIEPTAMQYMQQGILDALVPRLEGFVPCQSGGRAFMSPFVGFTDQAPNQRLACVGSVTGDLATLDLSEASDRVSFQHVQDLFANFPHLMWAVDATRSRKAETSDGRIIDLRKFASMGSALCFPVEEMVFLTIVFLAIEQELGHRLSRSAIKAYAGQVRVYGDDIVVPARHVNSVILALESFGFRVNKDKSFWNGKFRESCGKEYYAGVDVSIARFRRVLPTSRDDAEELISLVSFRNQMYHLGCWATCARVDEIVRELLSGVYPVVESTSAALGRESYLSWKAETADPNTQVPLVKAWTVASKSPHSVASDLGSLVKCLLVNDGSATIAEDHLQRYGRPDAVYIKRRYVTPY